MRATLAVFTVAGIFLSALPAFANFLQGAEVGLRGGDPAVLVQVKRIARGHRGDGEGDRQPGGLQYFLHLRILYHVFPSPRRRLKPKNLQQNSDWMGPSRAVRLPG